jgi:hypothetical protein
MAEHAWVQENLDTYLAGDLTTNERENVEQHVASCDACKQALTEARRLEQVMSRLFLDARPGANLDDRIIQGLSKEPARVLQRPTLRRFIAAAAAVLVVGLIGAVAQAISTEGGLLVMDAEGAALPRSQLVFEKKVSKRADEVGSALVAEFEKEIAEGKLKASDVIEFAQSAQKIQEAGYEQKAAEDSTKPGDYKPPTDVRRTLQFDPKGFYEYGEKGKSKISEDGRGPGLEAFRFYSEDMDSGKDTRRGEDKQKELMSALNTIKDLKLDKKFQENLEKLTASQKGLEDGLKYNLPITAPPDLTKALTPGYFATPTPIPASVPPLTPPAQYFDQPVPIPPGPVGEPKPNDKGSKTLPKGEEPPPPPVKEGGDPKDPKPEPKKQTNQPPEKKPQAADPPIEMNRKIIRTGEMEFEIDSFDKAVDNITRLITSVKGGFIATINSDKLPNGKMRGSVVVRMPPQFLDKFVYDLRRELAKSGEMKNQRIISQDVTKQYTDIESRLRAARTMEERLIQIIKIGKGEIKDLVAAERELGVWRTKIEEMEGELRYYANQVALSTLTISLYEKEILAPTALVVAESVRMRLEVDDVAKAHQTAMTAVEEMKGRITRSDLKQHSAGQLQSILCADIPPAKKDAFRDLLKSLGIVSAHEENQSQHAEGGTGRAPELKPRMSDVHFDVTMNNTANIRPRVSADLKIATSDVPGAYAKLLDEIARAKGQVRDGKLNEQDKLNINAQLDFNVPSAQKQAIDKVLADIGPVLERVNIRASVSEISTEKKFGYTVLLRDFASIPPSKAVVQIIAAVDVPGSYAKLQEAMAKAKAQVVTANLSEQDKLNINAQLDFTVLTEEKAPIDKLLAEIGTVLTRTNVQAPMNQLSTARKFGYTLVLRDLASIPPNKATEMKVAVNDVPASYAKFLEAIAKAKGKVADAKMNEQDKLHITAVLAFSVPSEEKAGIDKLLAEIGTVLSRNNVQAPLNQLATPKKFGYSLDLRDFANIPPSHASTLTIAASNVPGNYAKLVEAIAKAKGQVRDAKLNEHDKLNIVGQIDFTVPSAQKAAIEKLLADIGTMLSRTNVQAPVTELSTDGKFGYSVVLRDFANIPPRETFILQIALQDVSASFREFQETIVHAKGWVNVGKLVEDNKAKIEAQLDFDVPTAEKGAIEKLLGKAGAVLSRTSSQVPVNDLATDQKVGYRLSLRSTASIPPREKTLLKFEVADVDSSATQMKETILAGKGRIIDSNIDRHENGQVSAVLVFEVPFASQDTLIRQMKSTGNKLLSQRSTRDPKVQENELTTAHIIVTLTSANLIVPSDEGIASYVRTSLYLSFKILSIIVMTVVVGLSAVVPCVILLWIGFKVYAILAGSSQDRATLPSLAPAGGGSKLIAEEDKGPEGEPTPKP